MIYLLDTETTGFDEPKATEIAYFQLKKEDGYSMFGVTGEFYKRFNPGKPISLGATAITHIFNEDVADCPHIDTFVLPPDMQYLIAHNVDFDWNVLGKPDVKKICTLALSRYLFPDIDSHSQTAMMYFYFGQTAKEWVKGAHNALYDITNCFRLLECIIDDLVDQQILQENWTVEDLYRVSEEARIPTKMTFGKHKGTAIEDVPLEYVKWYMKQEDQDQYLLTAFKRAGKIK